ncbi:CBO2463/CBO2479 domain-containing protein [Acetoanaerobium noterae]|uniref:CBO2463/CBO2479 domain-containing protein n=1 Tax=Acetoanaerobium noterae TaxID=745369 RepID=UPI0028B09819|nr:CBO2463/CBO2479 domain-containing protein [Acetoanaerobium noterae]
MKYGDKIIYMEGIIVDFDDCSVSVDFKGRLGFLKVPKRMLITDYPLEIGLEVAMNMSFVEVLSDEVNEKYLSNIQKNKDKRRNMNV